MSRSTLAEALAAHRIERCSISTAQYADQWGRCTGCDFESERGPIKGVDWPQLQQEIYVAHVVAAVAAAGLAVISANIIGEAAQLIDEHANSAHSHELSERLRAAIRETLA